MTHSYAVQKILVVEDSYMNQKLAKIILENNGFNVTIAGNGEEAITILKQQSFDLILMDIQMPVMDGCQAAYIIRKELHSNIPIIALTAHALEGEREKCIREGMNDYLAKPFKEEDLLEKIAKYPATIAQKENDHTIRQLVDLSFLRKQTKNNTDFITEMIDLFITKTPDDLNLLATAIANKDFQTIYKTAHLLKNAIGLFGLQKVIGDDLKTMETLSLAEQDIAGINNLFSRVKLICEQAVEELKQHS